MKLAAAALNAASSGSFAKRQEAAGASILFMAAMAGTLGLFASAATASGVTRGHARALPMSSGVVTNSFPQGYSTVIAE